MPERLKNISKEDAKKCVEVMVEELGKPLTQRLLDGEKVKSKDAYSELLKASVEKGLDIKFDKEQVYDDLCGNKGETKEIRNYVTFLKAAFDNDELARLTGVYENSDAIPTGMACEELILFGKFITDETLLETYKLREKCLHTIRTKLGMNVLSIKELILKSSITESETEKEERYGRSR